MNKLLKFLMISAVTTAVPACVEYPTADQFAIPAIEHVEVSVAGNEVSLLCRVSSEIPEQENCGVVYWTGTEEKSEVKCESNTGDSFRVYLPNLRYDEDYSYNIFIEKKGRRYFSADSTFRTGPDIIEDRIPDPVFRKYCIEFLDKDGDGHFSQYEADLVDSLGFPYSDDRIESITGIELFRNLRKLNVTNCKFNGTLDVSACTKLGFLDASVTYIDELILPEAPKITELNLSSNRFTSLDLSSCKYLKKLDCKYNSRLKSLTLNKECGLEELNCFSTGINDIDLSDYPHMRCLVTNSYGMNSLNLGSSTEYEVLDLSLSDDMTTLDVSNMASLRSLSVWYCNLENVNIQHCPLMDFINIAGCPVASLDFSNAAKLKKAVISETDVTSLDFSNCPRLGLLDCRFNDKLEYVVLVEGSCSTLQTGPKSVDVRYVAAPSEN